MNERDRYIAVMIELPLEHINDALVLIKVFFQWVKDFNPSKVRFNLQNLVEAARRFIYVSNSWITLNIE
jgi:hypothetical protein